MVGCSGSSKQAAILALLAPNSNPSSRPSVCYQRSGAEAYWSLWVQ